VAGTLSEKPGDGGDAEGSETTLGGSERDAWVQEQYEQYPYPERDPAEEDRRLVLGSPSHWPELVHYVFGGHAPEDRPFRALVAGGGTGDATIMLGEALRAREAPYELMHLDLSGPSLAIARARAAQRGLTGINFVQGSLLEVASLAPGPWDYIDCCGVLHHLEEPEAGLHALASVLAPGGGMGLMLYGELGRTGVYHVRELLRALAPPGAGPDAERLTVAKRLLASLPPTAWLNRNGQIRDHRSGGDPGIFDLFLHARDRAYRVSEIFDLVAAARLRIASFIEPFRYDPAFLIQDPELRGLATSLPPRAATAFAEQWSGNLKKHVFYVVAEDNPIAPPAFGPDAVPILTFVSPDSAAAEMPPGGTIVIQSDGLRIALPIPAHAPDLIALCDGTRSIRAICRLGSARTGLPMSEAERQLAGLYRVMNAINQMVLEVPAKHGAHLPGSTSRPSSRGSGHHARPARRRRARPRRG